jgi:hypothetical protein
MGEATHKTSRPPREATDPLGGICIALVALGSLLLLPTLLFSLGSLITTGGRAWEYEPVRELFTISVIIFVLLIVLPLVARFSLVRNRRGAKFPAAAAIIASSSFGILFLVSAIRMEWAVGNIIISAIFFTLGASAFWLLRRQGTV